jgi:hypothetical protein
MIFEEVDIGFHVPDFLFDLLELGVDVFVVGIELRLTLDTLFLLFSLDRNLVVHWVCIKQL